ncbi:tumor necrosis factor alpha-induced protein 2-like isoform X3 [Simochromis diagramma]|uniref:tumor necrosis factor alpha-induced protein 2-like isoform X3 n=1 Tax=Simochromis diagramma TaxID=43689 RepID=UPI001A7E7781|nr:tumor necrosis factor alpha-induced protein 2-like isoform X3 [Simochromis diagramma]
MSQMMDKSTENPSNDTVSTKSNGSIKSDEKTSTDGGINVGMMGKFRRSLRLPTRKNPPSPGDKESKLSPESDEPAKKLDSAASPQPPSPSLSPGSASTSPKSNQEKEDDESDVSSHKSRPLTPSNTDPSMPKFENTLNRLRESIRWRRKKEVDTLPSEDLKEEKGLGDGSSATCLENEEKKEDEESDVSSLKSKPPTPSKTDPSMPGFDNTLYRLRESFPWRRKKEVDTLPSEDLKEEKGLGDDSSATCLKNEEKKEEDESDVSSLKSTPSKTDPSMPRFDNTFNRLRESIRWRRKQEVDTLPSEDLKEEKGLGDDSSATCLENEEKKEDEESDVSSLKSKPPTPSKTDPSMPRFDNTFNRLRESIRWRRKKEVDTLPSEDLTEEKGLGDDSSATCLENEEKKEDEESDVSSLKSKPPTPSKTDPSMPRFDNTFNRLRESFPWRRKKEVDTLPSEDLAEKGLGDDSSATCLENEEKKEDEESDVSSLKSKPPTPSKTDPSMPRFDNTFNRLRESIRWRRKKEVDTLPSEDLAEKDPNNTAKRKFSFKQKRDEDKPPSMDEKVTSTFEEYLETQAFCEATQQLIDREKHLFWETAEANKEAVEKLAADHKALEELVWHILQQSFSLSTEEASASALKSAVKAINLEEEQDQLWKQNPQTPPAWRPSEWKKHHDEVVQKLVNGRMDNPSSPTGDQVNQSTIQATIQSMSKQLKEDLQWVVEVVNNCYPPEMDICNFYAREYHQTFMARLRKIVGSVDDKDCSFLLQWVKESYPEILEKPELASNINTEALGNLLPDELLKPLEEQYLSKQQSDLMIFIGRVLDEAKKEWDQGKEPKRDDGCYASPVAYDVIQLINGVVTSAHTTVGDRHKAQEITSNLTDFMQRYQKFHEDVIKQNKRHSKALIKANLSCVEKFRDFLVEHDLFPENVRENCLQVLTEMKQSAHTYLLTPVHKILKPHYQKVGTSDWLKKNTFEKLLNSTEDELQELQGSTQSCHQELIGQLQQEMTVEYVRRLLKGEVKLKDKDRQLKAYETVQENAERLHKLFARMGSKQDWLKEILTKIAEVLKLQDIPAIQMQIVSLGSAYPDLSEKHVSALLKLKTNISKADRKIVKTTLSDTLKESRADPGTRKFFSKV